MLGFDFKYVLALPIIIVSHYLIDLSKLLLRNRVHSGLLFALDQLAHVGVILAVAHFYEPFTVDFSELYSGKSLLLLLALIVVSFVCAIVMKLIMSRRSLEEISPNDSLEEAGKYIGMLERLFVFGFIVLGQWQAIGFLLAAKSVFRFGDLSKAKDRKLTEYILIGTLLSFGLAISIGLAYQHALSIYPV